ncbi:uncharacterized protein LOC144712498 [Wolffia australiana]
MTTDSTLNSRSLLPESNPAPSPVFTVADFGRDLPSPKIGLPLPPAPDCCRLSAPQLLAWIKFVESTLKGRLLHNHLICPSLPSTDPHYVAFDAEQNFVHSWLLNHTLSPSVYDKYLHLTTPKEIRDHAHKYCGHDADHWRIFSLVERAGALRQGTMSIMDYSLAHTALWWEVDYYMPVGDPNGVDRRHTLCLRFLPFLNRLNPEYAEVRRRTLRTKGTLPDFDAVVKELIETESSLRRDRFEVETSADSTALLSRPGDSSGLLSRPPEQPKSLAPDPASDPRDKLVCTYCGKRRHTAKRCRKKQLDLQAAKDAKAHVAAAPASFPPPPGSSVVTMEQLQTYLAHLTAQLTALQTQPMASFRTFGALLAPSSDQWYCGHTALTAPLVSDTTWVLDTGATLYPTSGILGLGLSSPLEVDVFEWLASGLSTWMVSASFATSSTFRLSVPCLCLRSALSMQFSVPSTSNLTGSSYLTSEVLDQLLILAETASSLLTSASGTHRSLLYSICFLLYPSLKGHRWFLIFVDEATRYTWTYLLPAKSDIAATVRQFCAMVQTQFGRPIQRFRSDNARDYVNQELASYFAERAILHETSSIATPKQNGMAERRIGYVTSTARTLLLNYCVPWTYWGEAILTATHLINRLPSQPLQFCSPIDQMSTAFPTVTLRTNLLPRVFYVHDTAPTLTKLDAQAPKCIFVGYSSLQKGTNAIIRPFDGYLFLRMSLLLNFNPSLAPPPRPAFRWVRPLRLLPWTPSRSSSPRLLRLPRMSPLILLSSLMTPLLRWPLTHVLPRCLPLSFPPPTVSSPLLIPCLRYPLSLSHLPLLR